MLKSTTMDEKSPPVVETIMGVLLTLTYAYVLLDRNDRANGGDGLALRVLKIRDRYVKLWHYPERWRRAKKDLIVEATKIKMRAAGEL